MASITIAGVPEQVNIPISICKERGIFEKYGIEVNFRAVPEGTGKLLDMIEKGEADIALTVADATISGCAKGRPIQLVGSWVNSPLVWAIAGAKTAANDILFQKGKPTITDIFKFNSSSGLPLRFGISRVGSGSQTMAQYCCTLNHLPAGELQFEVANDFKGLRAGVAAGTFDAFMWEVFTTKPWFDREELQYLGEVPTPWPAFVFTTQRSNSSSKNSTPEQKGEEETEVSGVESVTQRKRVGAARGEAKEGLSAQKEAWIRERLFPALCEGARIFVQESLDDQAGTGLPASIQRIMREFGHSEADARLWMSRCRYSADPSMALPREQLGESVRILKEAGIVPETYEAHQLWGEERAGVNYLPLIM